jgi:hypothetical protein
MLEQFRVIALKSNPPSLTIYHSLHPLILQDFQVRYPLSLLLPNQTSRAGASQVQAKGINRIKLSIGESQDLRTNIAGQYRSNIRVKIVDLLDHQAIDDEFAIG